MIRPCDECTEESMESDLVEVKGKRLCRKCATAARGGGLPIDWKHPLFRAGAVLAAVPLVFSFHTEINGVYRDYPAIICGALAALCGVALLATLARAERRGARVGSGALLLALGVVQLTRGFGLAQGGASAGEQEKFEEAALAPCTSAKPQGCAARCESGDGDACDTLGVVYDNGLGGVPKDSAQALTWFNRGCEKGEMNACRNLAVLIENGRGTPADPVRALQLHRKACEGGQGDSCNSAAVQFDHGEGVPEDASQARALFEKSCALKSGQGCKNLGLVRDQGRGGPADAPGAAQAFLKACDLDHGVGCLRGGIALFTGAGLEKDEAGALKRFHRGCELKDADSCSNEGLMRRDGQGGLPKDLRAAANFFDIACDLGTDASSRGCMLLGLLLLDDDQPRAVGLLRGACKAGHEKACETLDSRKIARAD
jgi:TPR repeat protein